MEWLQNNVWIFVLIGLAISAILLVISILMIIKVTVITRNTVDSSLKMSATLMFESDHGAEFMDISIYNTNFRDVNIRDFGIDYRNQHLNFVAEFVEQKGLQSLPVVPARSSISFRVDPQRVEDFILAHNYKSKKVSTIYNVVIDSIGNQFKQKNRELTKILSLRQKARVKEAKFIIHNEMVQKYSSTHDGRVPVSDFFWRIFHRNNNHDNEIINVANSLSETDSFTKGREKKLQQVPDVQVEEKVSPEPSNSEFSPTNGSGEIKVTFLETDTKKNRRKKSAKKPVEETENEEPVALEEELAETDEKISQDEK